MNKIILIFLLGCSSSPILYPNTKFKRVGPGRANRDVDRCMRDGDKFIKSSKGKQILKGAARGSFVGGAIGAVSGLLSGDFIKGLITGSAFGAAAGSASAAISPDKLKRAYVNKCLNRKGYEIVGWD